MDKKLLKVLACPICKGKLICRQEQDVEELICHFHKLAYPICNGIPVMLVDRARRLIEEV
ncbi:Trm112 family protein [Coxiella endosymbiont of Amblyomma nuttalli]|uniref:Trm112 family protein n=1 Tax=Coxiella endosymbiont of Amblyomma nuttalli TaxID=2749996 RepID=UPI001BA94508|nr:Trm112 family protein [Coxiella endosymbiont of Amblyomma nuttalli]QTS84111.1 hypothetical protein CEAn_00609 [Coxiella endosymbiont of Amblyomma nuttalli]